jgi:ParB family chromosome partitioning protein
MTKRREAMERLLGKGAAGQGEAPAAPPKSPPREAVRAGAVRTMGLALDRLGAMGPGEAVEEIDTALCEPSFVRDRIEDGDDEEVDRSGGIAELAASIAEGGQAVPILVRPHPERPGRYQIAYGHRRWRACRHLGRPVRAIVRPLDDDALVVAQGRENNERRDLSFIERAEFAATLVRRGTSRAVVGRALAVDKSELARLLAVAEGLPSGLARAIGRAPKAGRPRWLRLLELARGEAAATALAAAARVQHLSTDARFRAVLDAVTPPAEPDGDAVGEGIPVRIRRGPRETVITVDEVRAAGFGEFVAERMGELYAQFCGGGTIRERDL